VAVTEIKKVLGIGADIVGSLIDDAKTWLTDNKTKIQNAFNVAVTEIKKALGVGGDIASSLISDAKTWLNDNETEIQNAFDSLITAIGNNIDTAIGMLTLWLKKEKNQKAIKNAFESGFEVISTILEGFFNSAIDYVRNDDEFNSDMKAAGKVIGTTLGNAAAASFKGAFGGLVGEDVEEGGTAAGSPLPTPITDAIEKKLEGALGETVTIGGVEIPVTNPDRNATSGQTGGFISRGGMMRVHRGERLVPAAQVTDRGQVDVNVSGSEGGRQVIEFTGDDSLTQAMADIANEQLNQQQRRSERLRDRGTRL